MKFTLSAVCLVIFVAVAAASSDAGHFIPKAFYTLDSEGHKSDLTAVNPHTAHYLRRLRRQTFTSSSSSSSTVQSDGGPTFFTSQQVIQHIPDVAPAVGVAGIASRFGESSSTGATGANRNPAHTTGHIVQTSGVVDEKGRIHFKTKEEHF